MDANPVKDSAPLSFRYWYLIILALTGFVTSFGAHIVATNLPSYAQVVGVGAFMIGVAHLSVQTERSPTTLRGGG